MLFYKIEEKSHKNLSNEIFRKQEIILKILIKTIY